MDWSYVAGFLDGEGSFRTYKNHPRMTVAQQDPEVLYRLMDFLDIKQAITFGSGGCYYLQICRKALVKRIIDGVYPFIIVKKVDIDKMLAEHWPADKRGV